MSADLALQKALRARLVATSAVTALVPASAILDRHTAPVVDPSLILGETVEALDPSAASDNRVTLAHTLHVWKKEPSFSGAKLIVAAIRAALKGTRPALENGYHLAGWRVASARFLRDPDGVTSHAVVTVEAVVGGGAL